MSDAVLTALFAAIPPTIVAFAGLVQSMRNAEIGRNNSRKLDEGQRKLEQVHQLTNGVSEKLQAVAKAEGHAEGVAQEKSEQRDRENPQ